MIRFVTALLLSLLPTAAPVHAQQRIALLIGNQGYVPAIGVLKNPHNDIDRLKGALETIGFEVTSVKDAGLADITRAVSAHVRRLGAAGPDAIGFFYFSGHGALNRDNGTNFLIPVDVKTVDSELWDGSVPLKTVVDALRDRAPNAMHFVVFDACRNSLLLRDAKAKALLQPKGFEAIRAGAGMLIAYATAEGEIANDAGDGAGPYASALAEEIVKPGVEAITMFRNVQLRVSESIGQEPWLNYGAVKRVWFAGREIGQQRIEEPKKQQIAAAAPKAPSPPPKPAKPAVAVTPAPAPASRCEGVEALVGNERRCLKPKDSFTDCPDCPEMVVVPAGSFLMGSPPDEEGRSDKEGPQHTVRIAKPFAVGRFEVTFAEWDSCVAAGGCKHNPEDKGWGRGRRPAIHVSWSDAKEYLTWLSARAGFAYRLLTEAEWEYAARAGSTTPYSTGTTLTSKQANVATSATTEVGSFPANAFGLHDMHGNVGEWVEDCLRLDYQGAPTDGSAQTFWTSWRAWCIPGARVFRGGSWLLGSDRARSAARDGFETSRTPDRGFRIARALDP